MRSWQIKVVGTLLLNCSQSDGAAVPRGDVKTAGDDDEGSVAPASEVEYPAEDTPGETVAECVGGSDCED